MTLRVLRKRLSLMTGMVWMSHETSSPYLCTAIMSIAYAFNGAIYSGHSNNSLTISPNRF